MKKERILKINKTFLEKAKAKMKDDFKKDINAMTDIVLIICLLGCYLNSKKKIKISKDEIFLAAEQPSDLENNYITVKVRIYTALVDILEETWKTSSDKKGVPSTSDIINALLASYIRMPLKKYTDCIAPLYTIVGSKNQTMQGEVAEAVKQMRLNHTAAAYIDGCCATGSLFFGLHTYPWKQVILNDLDPLRTNFLNVLLNKPLELVKKVFESDLALIISSPNIKCTFKSDIKDYSEKRKNYHKVACNVEIAFEMFIIQCIDKQYPDDVNAILNRVLRFLPAYLKMLHANTTITQEDCTKYLTDDTNIELTNYPLQLAADRLLLLDPPYIGSEEQCGVKGYKYEEFHKKVAEYLGATKYPFIYHCRSSAPKSDKTYKPEEARHIMKMKLGMHFLNKGFYFSKVELSDDVTELIISNRNFNSGVQFQWTDYEQDIR